MSRILLKTQGHHAPFSYVGYGRKLQGRGPLGLFLMAFFVLFLNGTVRAQIPEEGKYYTIKTGDVYLYFEASGNDKQLKGDPSLALRSYWEITTVNITNSSYSQYDGTYYNFRNIAYTNSYIIAGANANTTNPFSHSDGSNNYRTMQLVESTTTPGTYKIWSYRRRFLQNNIPSWFRYDAELGYVVWEEDEANATVFTIEEHTPVPMMNPVALQTSTSGPTTIFANGPYHYKYTTNGVCPSFCGECIPGIASSTTDVTYEFTLPEVTGVTLTQNTNPQNQVDVIVRNIPASQTNFDIICTAYYHKGQEDEVSASATTPITLKSDNRYKQIGLPEGEGYYLIHNSNTNCGYIQVKVYDGSGSLDNKVSYALTTLDSTCLWYLSNERTSYKHDSTEIPFYTIKYPFYHYSNNSNNYARLWLENNASEAHTHHGGDYTNTAYFGVVKNVSVDNGTYMLANYYWVRNTFDFINGNGNLDCYKPVLGLNNENPRKVIGTKGNSNNCWWKLEKQSVVTGITMPVIHGSSVSVNCLTPQSEYNTIINNLGAYSFTFVSTHGLVWELQPNWVFPENTTDDITYSFAFEGNHPSQVTITNEGPTLTLNLTDRLSSVQEVVVRCTATWNSGGTAYSRSRDLRVSINCVTRTPIATIAELQSAIANNPAGNYELTADFDASSLTGSISNFTGDIDGNYHTISGLEHPLFASLSGTVKNLRLSGVNIASGTDVGAIASVATGGAKVYNCGVLSGSVSGSGNVGGLVGLVAENSNVRVVNCYNYADISGGEYAAGIVGRNAGTISGTTTVDATGVRITNCMMYGNVTGATNISPVYGGNHTDNVQKLTEYNYWKARGVDLHYTAFNDQIAIPNTDYLTRFPFHRHILNTHREMAAYFLYGTGLIQPVDGMVDEIGVWVLDTDIAPYPIVKSWEAHQPSTPTYDPSNLPNVQGNYAGRILTEMGNQGKLTATVIIDGNNYSIDLPITDMDTLNFDYTWGKVVLPFANEFEGWTRDYSKIITGWKITSLVKNGATVDTYYMPTDDDGKSLYNFADRDNAQKDIYDATNNPYVFAQGGNWIVPYGVTAVTLEANFAQAFYLSDPCSDVGYYTDYKSPVVLGWETPYTYHGQTVYKDLASLVSRLSNSKNPNTQAIVLVGNYHYNQVANGTGFNTGKAVTIMSVDEDGNREPDYGWYTYFHDRIEVPPMRFDFVPNVGIGITARVTGSSINPTIGIWHTHGWFELTETQLSMMSECETADRFGDEDDGHGNHRWIANSGYFIQIVRCRKGNSSKLSYLQLGGNIYLKELYPGAHTDDANTTTLRPIVVTGGEIEQCFMTGYNAGATAIGKDIRFFCAGGKIGKFLGAYMEKPRQTSSNDGNVNMTAKIDHALIKRFYGGGTSSKAQISGNIDVTINNSYCEFYCGGPEFGDMSTGKTVTTHATNTTFGEYYGAGFGGTSITYYREFQKTPNDGLNFNDLTVEFPIAFTYYTSKRLQNKDNYGIGSCYKFEFIQYAGGNGGVARFYTGYSTFSLATTGSVTNILNGCTVLRNFYGAGCQGQVKGTVTSTLTDCRVMGSVYGGGYKARSNEVPVYTPEQPTYSVYYKEMGLFTDFGTVAPEIFTWQQGTAGTASDANKILYTNVDMPQLGKVEDNITLTIDGNSSIGTWENGKLKNETGNVFGGGFESQSLKNTEVIIKGRTRVLGNVYGGGNMAKVGGKTKVIFNGQTNGQ